MEKLHRHADYNHYQKSISSCTNCGTHRLRHENWVGLCPDCEAHRKMRDYFRAWGELYGVAK